MVAYSLSFGVASYRTQDEVARGKVLSKLSVCYELHRTDQRFKPPIVKLESTQQTLSCEANELDIV